MTRVCLLLFLACGSWGREGLGCTVSSRPRYLPHGFLTVGAQSEWLCSPGYLLPPLPPATLGFQFSSPAGRIPGKTCPSRWVKSRMGVGGMEDGGAE